MQQCCHQSVRQLGNALRHCSSRDSYVQPRRAHPKVPSRFPAAHFRPHTTATPPTFPRLPTQRAETALHCNGKKIPSPSHAAPAHGSSSPRNHRTLKQISPNLSRYRIRQLTEPRKLAGFLEERQSRSSRSTEPPQQEKHQQEGAGAAPALADLQQPPTAAFPGFPSQQTTCTPPGPPLR